ncbi:MAG: type II secretion system minor pseudopilin GspK, partial [Gallionellaceae bacterium]
PGGAEDNVYLDQDPPYRTSDTLLRSVTELLWIKGYTPEVVGLLRPYVTALPVETPVNVNTASAEVLMSLHHNLDASIADDIIENRGEDGYHDAENFLQQEFLAGITIPKESIGVSSQHFIVHGTAQFGNIKKQIHSMIVREKNKPTRVVLRSQGAY